MTRCDMKENHKNVERTSHMLRIKVIATIYDFWNNLGHLYSWRVYYFENCSSIVHFFRKYAVDGCVLQHKNSYIFRNTFL